MIPNFETENDPKIKPEICTKDVGGGYKIWPESGFKFGLGLGPRRLGGGTPAPEMRLVPHR